MTHGDWVDVVAGARPNYVKLAALWRAFSRRGATRLRLRLVDTGQHYDPELAGNFLRELGLPAPEVTLAVGSATHGAQTAAILERYERLLLGRAARPAAVVVVGDVNSTLACALAAAKLGIEVVHLEAGLRSFDRSMPEEINRVATDVISSLLLASEHSAVDNLRAEGIAAERIRMVGSLTVDTALHELTAARKLGMPARLDTSPRRYAYVTLHRPANVDDPARLAAISAALEHVAEHTRIVFAVHPRTAARLNDLSLVLRLERAGVQLLPPQPYREALGLMSDAALVITDSGGIQEETSVLGVPCLTLRRSTERPASVALGTNVLVNEPAELATLARDVRTDGERKPAKVPGWDGSASERALDALLEKLRLE